jgi:hypothetical protein
MVCLLFNKSATTADPVLYGGPSEALGGMMFWGASGHKFVGIRAGQNALPTSETAANLTEYTATYWVFLY